MFVLYGFTIVHFDWFHLEWILMEKRSIAGFIGINERVLIQSISRAEELKSVSKYALFIIWLP